jgi:hypothetical protein
MNLESKVKNKQQKVRKDYIAPRLVIFGTLRDLTQGGSKGNQESRLLCAFGILDKTRRPCSERRVKENIVRIADHPLGFGL